MALAAPPVLERKRVKVYELKRNDWHDRGTGFCTGTLVNDEPHLHVESEDDPARTLLETRICKDDGYQKQQDTLIVWTEANVTDMALSFQEAEGCASIWEFVTDAQQRLGGGPEDGFSEESIDMLLPPPELAALADIENMMRMANNSMASRDALAKYIVASEYIGKLVPLVALAEDLESLSDLHKLCNIMKTIILLNDQNVMDKVVSDEWWMGVIGALEYDPDFPNHKANHRHYLSDVSRFREVVKIDDLEVRSRFHKTYRLQYLKDVILARIIDDPTFGTINGSIYYHQFAIIEHIQQSPAILKELFGIFADSNADFQKKKDAVCFIQQSCAALKTIQAAQQRAHMFNAFIGHGLFHVVAFALAHPSASIRVSGADILMTVLEHDVGLIKGQIMRALVDEKNKPLLDTLIDLLLVETDLGVQTQIVDSLRFLLDPIQQQPPQLPIDATPGQRSNFEFMAKLRSNPVVAQSEAVLQKYYQECARKVFGPLRDLEKRESVDSLSVHEVSLFSQLLELLTHLTRQFSQRSKPWLLAEPLAPRVAQLLRCPEKHLKLSALKYFRSCISLHEQFHIRQIIQHQLCEPILDVLFSTMPRDNLLNSACLEFFEFIKRDPQENLKELIIHLGETYKDRLETITYVDTFNSLLEKYDKIIHPPSQLENGSFTSVDTEQTPQRPAVLSGHHPMNGGPHRWQVGLKDMDTDEDGFFHGSDGDNEDEERVSFGPIGSKIGPVPNGASPIKPLVDYPDDDDDEVDILAVADTSPAPPPLPSAEAVTPTPQPERIAEKRRREDDDDDDVLGKATSPPLTKRRSSSLGSIKSESSIPSSGRVLRRKGSINSGKDGGTKNMTISLAVKSGDGGSGGDTA